MAPFTDIRDRATDHIMRQFNDPVAQSELTAMGPAGVNWVNRTQHTLDTLIPELPKLAQYLMDVVPRKLNSASHLYDIVAGGERFFQNHGFQGQEVRAWFNDVKDAADSARELIGNLESQQVSAEIQRTVISDQGIGAIVQSNGNSIYPDLFLHDIDYSILPVQNRTNPIDGPCLRGARPSNVPDGCEIKTNRGNRIRVDAHGAHPGLHLGITWDFFNGDVEINGVWAAYVKIADHRESGRNVKVTTVKYSFGHNLFVSLL